jgi:hypothetical protein
MMRDHLSKFFYKVVNAVFVGAIVVLGSVSFIVSFLSREPPGSALTF